MRLKPLLQILSITAMHVCLLLDMVTTDYVVDARCAGEPVGKMSRACTSTSYYARATASGDFFVAPAHAEETYFPEVFRRSDSSRFKILGGE